MYSGCSPPHHLFSPYHPFQLFLLFTSPFSHICGFYFFLWPSELMRAVCVTMGSELSISASWAHHCVAEGSAWLCLPHNLLMDTSSPERGRSFKSFPNPWLAGLVFCRASVDSHIYCVIMITMAMSWPEGGISQLCTLLTSVKEPSLSETISIIGQHEAKPSWQMILWSSFCYILYTWAATRQWLPTMQWRVLCLDKWRQ